MTDNLTTTTTVSTVPSGTIISTDDAGASGHVQRVKLALSADGSAAHAQVDADGVLVNLGTNNDVTVTGTVTVDGSGVTQPVSGTVTANLSATDNAVLDSIDTAVNGTLTVDLGVNNDVTLATLPDTAAGDLAAINSAVSGTLTVDTELTTADLDTGAGTDTRAVVGLVGSASGGGALIPGSAADGLLVNLGTNNDVTVTGNVTANAGTNLNTSALALESGGNLATIAGAVAGTEVQVDVVTSALPTGAATAANQLPDGHNVTVDNAAGVSAVNIQDGGNSLTVDNGGTFAVQVDAALPAGTNQIGDVIINDIENGAGTSVMDAVNNAIQVNVVAGSAGGTEYTEDAAAAANPAGGATILVRQDTPAGLTTTDGDNVAQRGTNYGAAFVQVVDSSGNFVNTFGGSGGTAAADDADFVAGTTQGTLIQGVYESAPTSVTDGDMGAVGITQTRSMKVQETNSAAILADTANIDTNLGTVAGAVAGTEMQVDVVASLPAGDNNIGNVDIASSVALDVSAATVTVDLGANNDVTTELTTDDLDTGVGTDTRAVVGMVLAESGGGVLVGSANPMPVDGSGVTQPISAASLPLPTGAATAANQSTIIGHVDGIEALLTTIDADTSNLSVVGGGTEATAIRVTLANDSTGVVSVDDGGGALTVDGTVTANLSATDNAVLDQIEVNTSYGDNTGGGVEAGALRVTLASDSTGVLSIDDNGGAITVDNGGTFAVQAASAGDVAHDSADSGNPVKVGGKAYNFDGTVPGTAVAEADRTNFINDVYGRQFVETAHPNYWRVSADYAVAQTNATVKAAPGAGLKLYLTDIIISNGATAGNITLLDGSGGTVLLEIYPAINGGMSTNLRTPIALTANTLLAITSTTVTTHSVTITGYTAP